MQETSVKKMTAEDRLTDYIAASFRDPAGFVFSKDGLILRQVNQAGLEDYKFFMSSGLYDALRERSLIVPHQEIDISNAATAAACRVLKPFQLDFISYPYEWCFGQIKAAALATLEIQKLALAHDMTLKDASIYNIQLYKNRAVFIDTLSFEKYQEGRPWAAYRQFCEHFLCPLVLMKYCSLSLNQLLQTNLDGIPLSLTAKLLPKSTRLKWGLLSHIHLHAKTQAKYSDASKCTQKVRKTTLPKKGSLWLVDSLQSAITKLTFPKENTEWGDYYEIHNYRDDSFEKKKEIVSRFVSETKPNRILDIGANLGLFSRVASNGSIFTISADIDPVAVEKNYQQAVLENNKTVYPLVANICNPVPGIGWDNAERQSFVSRVKPDLVVALALIHHLCISNNLPFERIAQFFQRQTRNLIIEFVEKGDSQVEKLLANRGDTFPEYTIDNFETEFSKYFAIKHKEHIRDSKRTMYLMASDKKTTENK